LATAKFYSPRLDRDLISPLYHAAKSLRIPMTRLASTLIREGLDRLIDRGSLRTALVHEKRPAQHPQGLVLPNPRRGFPTRDIPA